MMDFSLEKHGTTLYICKLDLGAINITLGIADYPQEEIELSQEEALKMAHAIIDSLENKC